MNDVIVIGVDHGYAAMKTVHFSFPTGLVEYEHEPYTQKDVLECGGRYYVVGSGRQPLQRDKTQTEDYYLLTLAAIAKELEHRGAEHTASIHLAAGLPLTSFGRDKKSFRSYLYRDGSAIPFRYEGQDYDIICGTFFIAGLGQEDFVSLTDEQIQRYKSLYDNVQTLPVRNGNQRTGTDRWRSTHKKEREI